MNGEANTQTLERVITEVLQENAGKPEAVAIEVAAAVTKFFATLLQRSFQLGHDAGIKDCLDRIGGRGGMNC